ncbi:MAG: hypothetical protein WCF90_08390 [Methanomicrobiales archaeon]
MKALTRDQIRQKDDLANALAETSDAINIAIGMLNGQLATSFEAVEDLMRKYNGLLEEAATYIEEIRDRQESYMDDRSDAWREGDSCEEYQTWHEDWNLDMGEIEIDCPDPIDELDLDGAELLRDLPDHP